MPVCDALLAQFPTEQDDAVFDDAGKIQQTDVDVFHLHAGGIDLGERVFHALRRRLALALALRQRDDVHERPAIEEDAVRERLEFLVHVLDQLLALHRRAQQRLEDGQQDLCFGERECLGHWVILELGNRPISILNYKLPDYPITQSPASYPARPSPSASSSCPP